MKKVLKELLQEKTEQVQQMIKDQAKEYYENRAIMQRKHKTEQIKFEEQKDEEIRKLKAKLQEEKDKRYRWFALL
ncbi:hypothetical protein Tco_0422169 [Tanacetum coccineum]